MLNLTMGLSNSFHYITTLHPLVLQFGFTEILVTCLGFIRKLPLHYLWLHVESFNKGALNLAPVKRKALKNGSYTGFNLAGKPFETFPGVSQIVR